MKRIGIIGAMEEEVVKFKGMMTETETMIRTGMVFVKGKLFNKEVVVVRSGIGKVNAAVCAQVLVDVYDVGLIINTGVAGGICLDIEIGDIVISKEAMYHDVDASGFGFPLGEIPRMETSLFKADEALVERAREICEIVNPDIRTYVGRILTGDQFISTGELRDKLCEDFGGYCVEMEGAAIAHTAYLNGVDFLIIRAISDKADNSAKMDYKTFEIRAIRHTISLLSELLRKL